MNEHYSTIIKDDLPPEERDLWSFTLPCTINNMHFNKALADLGASIELNDLNEPLELRNHENESLRPTINEGEVIDELNGEISKTRNDNVIGEKIDKYHSLCDYDRKIKDNCAYNLRLSCMIGYEHVNAKFFLILSINVMSKNFYNSIMKDKIEYKGRNVVGAFINVPIFIGDFSVITDFAVAENMNNYRDKCMGDIIVGRDVCVDARRSDGLITIYNADATHTLMQTEQVVPQAGQAKRQRNEPRGLDSSWGDWNASLNKVERRDVWRDSMLIRNNYLLEHSMPILHHLAHQSNFAYPTYEPPYTYPYVPYPYLYTHYPDTGSPYFGVDHYGAHGDGYHAGSIVLSSGYKIGGSLTGFHGDYFDPICIWKIVWRVTMMICEINHVVKFDSKTLAFVG
ncbi:hypothetical protein Tco_1207586 [Tanacetum coccineum]